MCLSKEFCPKEKMNQFQCQSTNFCGPDVDLKINFIECKLCFSQVIFVLTLMKKSKKEEHPVTVFIHVGGCPREQLKLHSLHYCPRNAMSK